MFGRGRRISGVLVTLLLLAGVAGCGGGGSAGGQGSSDTAAGTNETTSASMEAEEGTRGATAETTEGTGGSGEAEKVSRARPTDVLTAGATDRTGGPLVQKRMVSYYGHPFSAEMGVLGEFREPRELAEQLQERAVAWTKVDPDRPAIPTIELIASVAQADPGRDGLYLTRTPPEVIEEYARVAEENGFLLLLDVQIGYSTIADEVEVLMPFLEREYVHLAIDPEYDMQPGEIPGQQFGSSSGEEIMAAARTLSELVEDEDLPPKVLVLHQFRDDMITDKQVIEPVPNVETVLHADGFGTPKDKIKKYDLLVRDQPIQYGGFKLFYRQDTPLLSPEQVLEALEPNPAVVSYQ
jgi:hypothetical protein